MTARELYRSCGGCGAAPLELCDSDCPRRAGGAWRPRRARAVRRAIAAVAVVLVLCVGALWMAGVR